jgi:hypothetical protein
MDVSLLAVVACLWRWFVLACSGLEDLRDGASLRRLFGSVLCHPAGPIGWRAAAPPLPWSRAWQIQRPHPQVVRPRWCGGLSASRSSGGNRGRKPTGTWSCFLLFPGVSSVIFGAYLYLLIFIGPPCNSYSCDVMEALFGCLHPFLFKKNSYELVSSSSYWSDYIACVDLFIFI